jgi:VWFA-related protein
MPLAPWFRAQPSLGLILCLLWVSAAGAQQGEYTLTSDTELVVVPVIVRDRDGTHVAGLKPQDFTLLQDGKTQSVAVFEEVDVARPQPRRRTRYAPGVFTNLRAEERPLNLVIVALDMINTTPEHQASSREEVLRALARTANDRTPTALLLILPQGVKIVHDFTTSPSMLMAALDRVAYRRDDPAGSQKDTVSLSGSAAPSTLPTTGASAETTAAGRLDQLINDINSYVEGIATPIANYKRGVAVASTLEAFEYIARTYAGVPGRKSLVWVTSGFPFEAVDESGLVGRGSVAGAYQQSLRALTDANIALYPVDTRGLINVGFGASPTRSARRARDEAPMIDAQYGEMMSRIGNIENLADTTGGRAFYNTNDVGTAFEAAAKDSSAYYLLGYYLKRGETKPGWHKLKVKVDREKVEIRAREGFLVREGEALAADERKEDILAALQAPVDFTQLPILLRWNHVETTPQGRKAVFDIELPPGAAHPDDQNRLNLDFIVVATTAAGEKVQDFSQNYTATLGPEGLRRVAESGVTYSNNIVVPPGRYHVRVVVRDNVTGRTGSLAAPLAAP